MSHKPQFKFDNSFARSLEDYFSYCEAEPAVAPKWLQFNHGLAEEPVSYTHLTLPTIA